MKKVVYMLIIGILCASIVLYFTQGIEKVSADDVEILRVYNWEEYISEGDEDGEYADVISDFETYCQEVLGRNVIVEYSTFGTNENMYNELNMSKKSVGGKTTYSYDLVCPSEYMIMKMIREDMLETIDKSKLENYYNGASGYLLDRFENLTVDGKKVSDYAACYMWGTMGFVYNPEFVEDIDAFDWSLCWNEDYKGTSTIKDSVRDSYVLAIGYVYQDELLALSEQYSNGELDAVTYNAKITEIFDRTDSDTIELVKNALLDLKDNIFGYEVDSGKKDMAQGKILINFAWSGDGVYTLDTAEGAYDDIPEDEILELSWAVPTAGSNIWFDGWVMPKGSNTELSLEFINYLSRPDVAVSNMSYIGYTSAIAGDSLYENAVDWYGYAGDSFNLEQDGVEKVVSGNKTTYTYFEDCDFETALSDGETEVYKNWYITEVEDGTTTYFVREQYFILNEDTSEYELDYDETFEVFEVDLSYFFDNLEEYDSASIFTDTLGRQFSAQYPDFDTVTRCTIMKSFTDSETKDLNDMWQTAKIGRISSAIIWSIIGALAGIILVVITLTTLYKKGKIFQPKAPKGYTLKNIDLH